MPGEQFQLFFENTLRPLLESPDDFPEAIKRIEAHFAALATQNDRAEAYHWLGTLHNMVAVKELSERDVAAAREHFNLAEEFFLKALDESPMRLNTRITLARYYISPMGMPERAFPLLSLIDDPAIAKDSPGDFFYRHELHVLRGVVLGMLGSLDEATEELIAAYGEEFHGRLEHGPDLSSLNHLAVHEVRFPKDLFEEIAAALRSADVEEEKIRNLAVRLSE